MTLEELYTLTDLDTVIHTPTGDEYVVELYPNLIRLYNHKYRSHIKIVISNPIAYQSYHVHGLQPCGYTTKMLDQFKKKEESKMKTEFTMPPQTTKVISYPKFMLRKADGIVVLFFNQSSGVVVVSNKNIPMNYFSTTWDWDMFTPVEGCSVTFSDKD